MRLLTGLRPLLAACCAMRLSLPRQERVPRTMERLSARRPPVSPAAPRIAKGAFGQARWCDTRSLTL